MQHYLKEWRIHRGLSQEALGTIAGTDKSQISKLEAGQRQMTARWLETLAGALQTTPADLLKPPAADPGPIKSDVDMTRRMPVVEGARDLPVYGSVKGSFVGEAVDALNPVEWLVRPPILIGVARGFGVYVVGPSMEPRYHQGEIVLVHPGRPAARGAYVVVMLSDDTAILKRLVRQTDDFVEVEQINPPEKTRLPRAKVAGVFRVVGTQEG